MSDHPVMIMKEVEYLLDHGFLSKESINNDLYLFISLTNDQSSINSNEINILRKKIVNIYPRFGRIFDLLSTKFWLYHKAFINTYPYENMYFKKYGIDSWIYYLNKVLPNKKSEVYNIPESLGLNYFNIISHQLSSNKETNMLSLEHMNKENKKQYISYYDKTKFKMG